MRDLNEALVLDSRSAMALYYRCDVRAIVGALDEALADCQESLRIRPDVVPALDSRGLVYLKRGALDEAIADYDAALRIHSKHPYSLFGRGVARRMKGDVAGGDADIAAAKTIYPRVADHLARYGVKE
jgi:tetratricopeptide (TPR) repeat protein